MADPPGAVGWWLREALATEPASSEAPSAENLGPFDVAIVGGGYTGLWTAWWLTERLPGARIAIIEQGICGGGPSGRNGGFVHGWWDQLPYLLERFGPDDALRLAHLVDAAVGTIGEWCEANDVDAWYRHGGYLRVSASAAQDGEWRSAVEACAGLGVADQYVELSAAEIQARCASPAMRGGALMRNAATVQPARLARGLRLALGARGVTILEGTRVTRLRPGSPVQLETERGPIGAEQVVLALNAWAAGWRDFATTLLAWGSHIVLTEPIPGRLAELGWTGGEAIADARFTVHYFRTTPDGRLAFGAGVGAAGYGGRVDRRYDSDPRAEERACASLRRFFPILADVRIDDAWGGPIDISPDRLPMIGSRHGGRVHFAHGFSGNGVAPAVFAGRVLAGLIDEPQGELARLPIVDRRLRHFPPEPVRFAGVRVVREALIRRDEAEDAGRRPPAMVRFFASLPRLLGYRFGAGKPPSSQPIGQVAND
ncbi:MAG TPA: FAD-dependent oxidoreductase [Candidatus Limnocylindria bacterium]|nr:FAD-dependent oxidoreductase [Candidatus Limnocylindria bacterium]